MQKLSLQKHIKNIHLAYIDDLSEAEAIDLKEQLVIDPVQRPQPLNHHERTQHILPSSESHLQKQLLKNKEFTIKNKMKINQKSYFSTDQRNMIFHQNSHSEMVNTLKFWKKQSCLAFF